MANAKQRNRKRWVAQEYCNGVWSSFIGENRNRSRCGYRQSELIRLIKLFGPPNPMYGDLINLLPFIKKKGLLDLLLNALLYQEKGADEGRIGWQNWALSRTAGFLWSRRSFTYVDSKWIKTIYERILSGKAFGPEAAILATKFVEFARFDDDSRDYFLDEERLVLFEKRWKERECMRNLPYSMQRIKLSPFKSQKEFLLWKMRHPAAYTWDGRILFDKLAQDVEQLQEMGMANDLKTSAINLLKQELFYAICARDIPDSYALPPEKLCYCWRTGYNIRIMRIRIDIGKLSGISYEPNEDNVLLGNRMCRPKNAQLRFLPCFKQTLLKISRKN